MALEDASWSALPRRSSEAAERVEALLPRRVLARGKGKPARVETGEAGVWRPSEVEGRRDGVDMVGAMTQEACGDVFDSRRCRTWWRLRRSCARSQCRLDARTLTPSLHARGRRSARGTTPGPDRAAVALMRALPHATRPPELERVAACFSPPPSRATRRRAASNAHHAPLGDGPAIGIHAQPVRRGPQRQRRAGVRQAAPAGTRRLRPGLPPRHRLRLPRPAARERAVEAVLLRRRPGSPHRLQ